MPLLKEVPREVKEGKKRERRWVRQLWMKKNWMWAVPACVSVIVALVLLIIGIVWYSQRGVCHLVPFFPSLVTEIRIGSEECNYEEFGVMDLSRYKNLKSVVIGKFCFSKVVFGENPNRHFYLKNCPKLKSLKMGRYSFSDYSVIEIESVDALEVIEIGDLSYDSSNFYHASLELKSIHIHSE